MSDELTIQDRIGTISDIHVKDRIQEGFTRFSLEKTKSVAEFLQLYGWIFECLAHDVISSKKAEAFCKVLSGAASCKKEFLGVEFPEEMVKQFNETLDRWKIGITSALQHLLSEPDFKKVMKEVGKELGWSESTAKKPS